MGVRVSAPRRRPGPHGPWHIEETRDVYRSDWFRVTEDRVRRPDGRPSTYATVAVADGVGILPVDDDLQVTLVRQFRYAIGAESLEVTGGAVDEGEDPLQGARRELEEELGLTARDWTDLGTFDADTSIVYGRPRLFLARGLERGRPRREGTEVMAPVALSLADAVAAVMSGRVTQAMSVILVLKAARRLGV